MAVAAIRERGRLTDPDKLKKVWEERIGASKRDRGRYEPNWQMCLAFAAGKHFLEWSRLQRKLVLPDWDGGERYAEDIIGERRMTAIGELGSDDDRPQLRFREQDIRDRDYAAQANRALAYAWDEELDADEVLLDLRHLLVDLGTAALQCRWDPTVGPVRGNVPHHQGEPIYDTNYAFDLVSQGQRLQIKDIHEGRLRWRVLSPFQLLPPPGVLRERDFPWEVIVGAFPLEKVREEYGKTADDLSADGLSAVNALGMSELSDARSDDPTQMETAGKLDDHVLVYQCFERPTRDYPRGRTVVLGGGEFTPLKIEDRLPYEAPDGTPRSGVTYFHYWRLADRFWSQGVVDKTKDIQRRWNRRRSQGGKIIDRAMPAAFVEEGSEPLREGEPMELIRIPRGATQPTFFNGVGPGPWMAEDCQITLDALSRASQEHDVSLGENPVGQGTYSGIALLRDSDQVKKRAIIQRYRGCVRSAVADTVYDIRRYWGKDKQIALAGEEEGLIDAAVFNASEMPTFYLLEQAKGGAKPRSEADELAKVDSIASYSVNSRQPLPVGWYAKSLDGGEAEPIPEAQDSIHEQKADLENSHMMEGQQVPPPADFDPLQIHLPRHREAQIEAELGGRAQQAALIARHIQEHEIVQQRAIMEQAQMGAPQAGGAPNLGPGAPTPVAPAALLAHLIGRGHGAPPPQNGPPAGAPPMPPPPAAAPPGQ